MIASLLRGVSVLLALTLIVLGALSIVGSLGRDSTTFGRTYAGVRVVDVDVSVESVRVVAAADATSTTRLDRSVSWSLARADISQRKVGDRLVVRSSCPMSFGRGCSGRVELVVPAGIDLRVHSSAGSVRAVGLAGVVALSSSAGSVQGVALRSAAVTADSSAGATSLEFAVAPTVVQAGSSAGSVEVLVPRGPTTYRVTASSSAGSSEAAVRTDPSSPRRITAHSSAGSVRVGYLP